MLRLTKHQYAQLVRSVEHLLKDLKHHLKGSGPDGYELPSNLETYLYRHPMSMVEFYVDDNGVKGGGFKSSFKKLFKKIGQKVGVYKKKAIAQVKEKVREMAPMAKEKLSEKLDEGKLKLQEIAKDMTDDAIDKAQAGVEKITQKVTGSGHCAPKKKMHMHGCGFAPGSVMTPGYGLNVSNLGFVQAPIPAGAYVNQVAVPFYNHLQEVPLPPAGGYGGYAFDPYS